MTDIQTLFLVNIFVSVTLSVCVALVASPQDRSLRVWAAAFALHGVTYVLFTMRGVLPDFLSVVVANSLIAVMFALFAEGLLHFQKRAPLRWVIWGPVVLLFLVFLMLMEQLVARVIVSSVIFAVQSLIIIVAVLQGLSSSIGRGKWIIVFASLMSMVLFLQRGVLTVLGRSPIVDLQTSNIIQIITFLGSSIALIMFAIGLLVMFKERAEHRSHTMALHDPLTQLGNRRLMHERLQIAFQNSALHRRFAAKLLLDLDKFKLLNDTHGHAVGDQLLVEVARRLRGCVHEDDTIVRLGGDEFVVLIEGLDSSKDKALEKAAVVARRIRDALAEPYVLVLATGKGESVGYQCSCSIGVALFVGQVIDSEELFKRADTAMYRAKQNTGQGIHFHDAEAA